MVETINTEVVGWGKGCKSSSSILASMPEFDVWDKSLWSKGYDEIIDYIMDRFKKTSSELEYYMCLLYLEKHLSEDLRYLPYKDSVQYKKSIGEIKSFDDVVIIEPLRKVKQVMRVKKLRR